MTTRKKLIFQIKRLLSAGTTPKDSKLNDDYIGTEVDQVAAGLFKVEVYNNKNQGYDGMIPLCIATYTASVLNDTVRKRNYCVLPVYPMSLPGGVGVQQVKPYTGIPAKDVAMIPIQPQEYELFKSLLVGAEILNDQFTFEVDRDKVWFTKKSDKTLLESSISTVELRIVVNDPSQIGNSDNYPIPPEMEMDVIRGVLLLHGYKENITHDMVNDDRETTR